MMQIFDDHVVLCGKHGTWGGGWLYSLAFGYGCYYLLGGLNARHFIFHYSARKRNGVGELSYTHEGFDPGVAVRLHGP